MADVVVNVLIQAPPKKSARLLVSYLSTEPIVNSDASINSPSRELFKCIWGLCRARRDVTRQHFFPEKLPISKKKKKMGLSKRKRDTCANEVDD